MSDLPFIPPKYITVLTPMKNGKRGRYEGRSDKPRTFRMPDDQYAVVVDASRALDITPAEFIRWVLYMTANETLAQQNIQGKKK